MTIKNLFIIGVFTSALLSCTSMNNKSSEIGTIVRDCTGTYVRIAEKGDFLVCNDHLLKSKNEGDKVSFTYEITNNCPEKDGLITCMMYHENKGMIKINTLK